MKSATWWLYVLECQSGVAKVLDDPNQLAPNLNGYMSSSDLQEYRTALITAAVTGKIDVRWKVVDNTLEPVGVS